MKFVPFERLYEYNTFSSKYVQIKINNILGFLAVYVISSQRKPMFSSWGILEITLVIGLEAVKDYEVGLSKLCWLR